MEFRNDKLADVLAKVQGGGARLRRILVQPDGRVGYETLLGMLSVARGEDGELFERAELGGGGVV